MKKSKVIYKVVVPGFEENFGDLYKNGKFVDVI